jgi:hypothetical protein
MLFGNQILLLCINFLLFRYTVNPRVENGSSNKFMSSKNNNNDVMAIRIKARYQNVEVLPLIVYDRLIKFVTVNYLPLCHSLETCLAVKTKEDFATCLVRILHKQRVVKDFLCDIIMAEIGQLGRFLFEFYP